MKEHFNKKNLIINLFAVPLIIYTIYLLCTMLSSTVLTLQFPNEFREAANIQMTRSILAGDNPYSLASLSGETPGAFYLYGPLMSLIAALIAWILPMDVVIIHYAIAFSAMVISGILIGKIIYDHCNSITAPIAGFLFTIMCHWRYGYIYAAPDSLGLMILILILFILTRPKFQYKAYTCAALTVAIFFTKQYYFMIFGTTLVYFLFLSKKETVKYVISTILIFVTCGILIAWKFPLFFTYAIYFVKGPGAGVSSGKVGTSHNTMQVTYLGGMFIALFIVGAYDFIRAVVFKRNIAIKWKWKKPELPLFKIEVREEEKIYGKRKIVCDLLFWGQMAAGALVLQYLGKNDGAFLSYYLQLFLPALIVVSLTAIDNYKFSKAGNYILYICYAFLLLFTIVKTDSRLIVNQYSDDDMKAWERAYAIMDEYADQEVYEIPAVAYKGFEQNKYVYNNGQPFVITDSYLEQYEKNELAQKLFPYAGQIMEQHLNYRQEVLRKVRNGEYALITDLKDADVIFTEEDLQCYYKKSDTRSLKTGNWSWDIDFWVRKGQ